MILIRYEKLNDKVGTVTTIEYNTQSTEIKEGYMYLEKVNVPNPISNGMRHVLRVDLKTKELYYDYYKVKDTQQQVDELYDRISSAENSILLLMADK